jgi:hypothetical protein
MSARRETRPAVAPLPLNIVRDQRTVEAMVRVYCRHAHPATGEAPCPPCAELLAYAEARLARCPFGDQKTTCRECPIHCYRPAERARMRVVMKSAGPRMLWRHPLLAVRHLWIERRGAPPWPPKKNGRGSRDPRPFGVLR